MITFLIIWCLVWYGFTYYLAGWYVRWNEGVTQSDMRILFPIALFAPLAVSSLSAYWLYCQWQLRRIFRKAKERQDAENATRLSNTMS